MQREFGSVTTKLYRKPETGPATETISIRPPRQQYLIVDGYNIIFAWESLAAMAKEDLEAARRQLMDRLSSYAGFKKCRVVLVFDGYKVKGNPGEKEEFSGIQVVFTKENETADAYMEALAARIGGNYNVRLASSDALVQISGLRSGVLRVSARELYNEILQTQKDMKVHYHA